MNEPTNDELKKGTWQQPPPNEVVVQVPEGAYAKLEAARARYPKISKEVAAGYAHLSNRRNGVGKYIKQGDITHDMAARLTIAKESTVFDRIVVLFPAAKYASVVDVAVIGVIATVDGDRYFQLHERTSQRWDNWQLVERTQTMKRNAMVVLIVLGVVATTALVLAFAVHPWWLLVCTLAMIAGFPAAYVADGGEAL